MPPNQPQEIDLLKVRNLNPVFKGLKILLLILPVFLILLLVNRALIGDWLVVSILTVMILITLYASVSLQNGKVAKVTMFLSLFFTLTVTAVCTIGGGIHDIVIVAYPLVLGFSSILLKIKETIITAVVTFISICWLVINEEYSFFVYQNIKSGFISDFVSTSTLVAMGGFLTYQITRNIKESLQRANVERDKKIQAARNLNQELEEKNQLIEEVHRKVSKSLGYISMLTDLKNPSNNSASDEYKNLHRKIISIEAAHKILGETSGYYSINLATYVPDILERYKLLHPSVATEIEMIVDDILISLDETVSFGFCFLELLHQELSNGPLSIRVSVKEENAMIELVLTHTMQLAVDSVQQSGPSSILIDMMVRQLNGQLERTTTGSLSTVRFNFNPKETKDK